VVARTTSHAPASRRRRPARRHEPLPPTIENAARDGCPNRALDIEARGARCRIAIVMARPLQNRPPRRSEMGTKSLAVATTAWAILATGCASDSSGEQTAEVANGPRAAETALVSDGSGAAFTDPKLVNAWGVARDEDGLFWIADNGTGAITIVDASGAPSQGEYRSDQFMVGEGITGLVAASDPALDADFMVASETGQLFRINGDERADAGILFASEADAIYKGIAVETVDGAATVLAADFHHGRIDAFDARGKRISCNTMFVDPGLPSGYGPFNVLAADGMVYVAYAQQDEDKEDEIAGVGLGLIDVFDAHGTFVRRFATGGDLNAPWGLARVGNLLFVGNFGDGRITTFDVASGRSLGQFDAPAVDGLWGIVAETPTTLYVTAGPDDEQHGLFARLSVGR
jgi:uncharacterized protein (TIGR03118 family)